MTFTLTATIKDETTVAHGQKEALMDESLGMLVEAYPTISRFWTFPKTMTPEDIRRVIADEGINEEVTFDLVPV